MRWKETADKSHRGRFSYANCSSGAKRLCLGPASSPALGTASGVTPGQKIPGKEDFVEKRKKQLVLKLSSEKKGILESSLWGRKAVKLSSTYQADEIQLQKKFNQ